MPDLSEKKGGGGEIVKGLIAPHTRKKRGYNSGLRDNQLASRLARPRAQVDSRCLI